MSSGAPTLPKGSQNIDLDLEDADDPILSSIWDTHLDNQLDFFTCECGSDTTFGKNNSFHSTWCPKYRVPE